MNIKKILKLLIILIIFIALIFSSACTSTDGSDKYSQENGSTTAGLGGNEPFISTNPVIWSQEDQVLNVTGTTDFPAGTAITIFSGLSVHPCPISPPGVTVDTGGVRSLCNGNCSTEITESVVYAVQGFEENNTWNCLVNTTEWCCCESYFIRAEIITDNKTIQDTEEFRFSG
ncbi:hypothetical protein [Methanolacinia paynteri]|uniref:hypothetical protein n=1 Tax=Methanolacinia paynteri TaxID=230356 RepID=UPI00064F886A|nr:hypothetical protein [Methanolacinia paynteri]